MGARGKMGREGKSLVAGVRLKACVFIGLAVHALIYILLIFKFGPFDLYRGACGGGREIDAPTPDWALWGCQFPVCNTK